MGVHNTPPCIVCFIYTYIVGLYKKRLESVPNFLIDIQPKNLFDQTARSPRENSSKKVTENKKKYFGQLCDQKRELYSFQELNIDFTKLDGTQE